MAVMTMSQTCDTGPILISTPGPSLSPPFWVVHFGSSISVLLGYCITKMPVLSARNHVLVRVLPWYVVMAFAKRKSGRLDPARGLR